jgi:thiamine-phosphate diphosphorylase
MRFPSCDDKPLGIYPIVDRARKLKPLYECGITTAQLRVKDLSGSELEDEVVCAIELSRQYNVRFFLNDYWQLAIKHQAYGVHLGQEDIQECDIQAIHNANLRLGISSHTPKEIEIALGFEPSYLAIGPIFEPISKTNELVLRLKRLIISSASIYKIHSVLKIFFQMKKQSH